MQQINWVNVPLYDELKPSNIIKTMELKEKEKDLWKELLNYCPELATREQPRDRTFFFNILNTLKLNCIDKLV